MRLPRPHAPFLVVARRLASPFFPESCWITGVGLTAAEQGLSLAVRRKLEYLLNWPYCFKCGLTLGPHSQTAGCPRCASRSLTLRCLLRAGPLHGPLASMVHQLKFRRQWGIAPVLADWMAAACRHRPNVPMDILIPVPLHPVRQWSRGFNQAAELAHGVGDRLNLPIAQVLRRRRATRPQTRTQSAAERRDNLRGAFAAVDGFDLACRHVWLVDDVCTTGATLHAAAGALRAIPRDRRPASINALVAAVADDTPIPDQHS